MHQPPQGESIWGTINTCMEIALNIYAIVAKDEKGIEHEGIMVHKDEANEKLSSEAVKMGQEDGEWLCYDENTQDIPMYEVLQRRMAECKRIENIVMRQMEELKQDNKLTLTDYFGECPKPEETPIGQVEDTTYVRNGIYLIKDCDNLKFAVHDVIADNFMTPMAIEYGARKGEYLFYDTDSATCAAALNELKNVFEETAALIISEDSLYATLHQNLSTYTTCYNMCMSEKERIPNRDAPVNLFLSIQLEDANAKNERESRSEHEEEGEIFGEQVDYEYEQ